MTHTVHYTVRFPRPHNHYAEVEALFPAAGQDTIELFLPVWTPGSYLIREYARHVEDVQSNGRVLEKTRKNRWRVETNGAPEVRVTYRVYCHEMSVRTNWVEDSFALLIGAATFMTVVASTGFSYELQIELPPAWKRSASGLTEIAPHRYSAPDYDTLIDSPIYAGNPSVHRFEIDGIPHDLVTEGECDVWFASRAVSDLCRIVQRHRDMWGSPPYTKYVFLNMVTEGGGGLEHKNSVCMMTSRWSMGNRRSYLNWLSLASHEFFHVWNVKRLRPVELGPFDYETENHTTSLWVAEGLTEYYGQLLVHRAGLSTREEYLAGCEGSTAHDGLSGVIRTLQTTPGRLVMPVGRSSYDAWIKLYRPDENSQNTSISYYVKGAVIGWLLDARIRRATDDAKSLDDLMRLAYARHSGERGFTPDEIKEAASEVAGTPLDDFFRHAVDSTEELDYSEALDWFGLRFRQDPGEIKPWIGAHTKNESGRLTIDRIPRGTPAYESGLNAGDEIVAIGGFRVSAEHLARRLESYRVGAEVSVLVARRERMLEVPVKLGAEPTNSWRLELLPHPTAEQKRHLERWLQ
ncbi:MAG TPA: PDZ domain-containing protein [Bryobacteraceae bacterium]|nr:PDZ domain-containing protein [Bryobacteraceae bacterium]